MSTIAWVMSLPQFILVAMVVILGFRAHRASEEIRKTSPKAAGRIGNFSQGVILMAIAYILTQGCWASSQPADYRPVLADVVSTAWELLMLVHLLVWIIVVYEVAKDRLAPKKACRPCPLRGEGELELLDGLCCKGKSA